jgi:hypothetical protein
MTVETLLSEIAKKSDFIFTGWNILMLAGIGVILATPFLRGYSRVAFAVRVAFGFFAATHLLGMLHVLKQWASLEDGVKFLLADNSVLREHLAFAVLAPHPTWVVPFHLLFDIFVVATAWWANRQALVKSV